MKLNPLTTVLALVSSSPAVTSAKAIEERNPTGPFELIAYGIAPSYINIFYSDGLAYAGDSSLWTYGKITTDVTFLINNTRLATTATTPGVTLDAETSFYIRPTEDAITSVGFTGNGATVPPDATAESFLFYGTYLMWEEFGGELSDSFRLQATNASRVYQLYWDQSNLYPSGYLLPGVESLSW